MHNLCVKIANFLAVRTDQPDREPVLAYGLEILFGELSKLIVLFGLAAVTGLLKATILVVAAAVPLRQITGGTHCSSHLRCLLTSLIMFLPAAWAAEALTPFFNTYRLPWIITLAYSYLLVAIYLWVPVKNEQRQTDTAERKNRFRQLSFILVTLWFLSGIVFILLGGNAADNSLYFSAATTGLLLQGLMISPIALKVTSCLST